MAFPKQLKDNIYDLLQEPTLDRLREFLHSHTGEHNSIDFKQQWITGDKLAKLMLALANSQGGIILFGISENEDGSVECTGLNQIKDKAVVDSEIKKYISTDLKYEIYDFSYSTSEYEALQGKNFQLMVIEDVPEHIPFMSLRDGSSLKCNEIYIRRGTSCEKASRDEIESILRRRINYMHPVTGEPLKLEEHLNQLKILYDHIEKEKVRYTNKKLSGLGEALKALIGVWDTTEREATPNPLYPDESYEEFISRLITNKKNKIERVLDLY